MSALSEAGPTPHPEGARETALVRPIRSKAATTKVHAIVVFSRYKADGSRYVTYPTLWIVTKLHDQWGIQIAPHSRPSVHSLCQEFQGR